VTPPNRTENSAREAALGDDALRAAEALLGLGLHNDAVSRAYYAAFHYGRALLLLEGLEPKSHRGVFAPLERHFEATGRLSAQALSRLARLQTFRGMADYDASDRLHETRATEEVASAREFVEEARRVLSA
jgi:uncharacterized protein